MNGTEADRVDRLAGIGSQGCEVFDCIPLRKDCFELLELFHGGGEHEAVVIGHRHIGRSGG